MEIHIGNDHRGFTLKQQLCEYLSGCGHTCVDHGCDSDQSVDYPSFAIPVAQAVVSGSDRIGVLLCGSGTGMAIAANKVKGCRCVQAWCEHVAEYARRHNNANVLAFGADLQTFTMIKRCLDAFLAVQPEGGRHARRLEAIANLEAER